MSNPLNNFDPIVPGQVTMPALFGAIYDFVLNTMHQTPDVAQEVADKTTAFLGEQVGG